MEFCWEVVPHACYSPDLAPIDYKLFRHLQNFFTRKAFDDMEAVKTAVHQFFDFKDQDFDQRAIHRNRSLIEMATMHS